MDPGGGVVVRRAAVRGRRGDAIRARRDAEALLATLPAPDDASILCLRRVSLPLARRGRSMMPDGQPLAEAVRRLRASAARPVLGPVPSRAEAVLFDDRSELLACLARDVLAGVVATRWWWALLLPQSVVPGGVADAWVSEAVHVPAALQRLAAGGHVIAFVRLLGEEGCRRVARTVIAAYGLTWLAAVAEGVGGLAWPDPQFGRIASDAPDIRAGMRAMLAEATTEGLSSGQRLLLATGLALVRLPRLVRRAEFAAALPSLWPASTTETAPTSPVAAQAKAGRRRPACPLDWTSPEAMAPDGCEPSADDGQVAPPSLAVDESGLRLVPHAVKGEDALPGDQDVVVLTLRSPRPTARRGDALPGGPAVVVAGRSEDQPKAECDDALPVGQDVVVADGWQVGRYGGARPPGGPSSVPRVELPPAAGNGNDVAAPLSLPNAEAAPEAPGLVLPCNVPVPEPALAIESGFGGILFLANAALSLGLYADFSRPLDPGLELPFWDFLALVGAGLDEGLTADPLWPLLAAMSGRGEGEAIGEGAQAPSEWRLPATWCEVFRGTRRPWRWRASKERLRLVHGAGFVLVDVARNACRPSSQLAAELAAYRDCGRRSLICDDDSPPPALEGWARWQAWFVPYLRCRLRRALGVRSDAMLRRMLRVPARIVVRTARVEAHMCLSDLPIAVRLAGLDRNTGWIPAAGRSLDFIFEVDDAA